MSRVFGFECWSGRRIAVGSVLARGLIFRNKAEADDGFQSPKPLYLCMEDVCINLGGSLGCLRNPSLSEGE